MTPAALPARAPGSAPGPARVSPPPSVTGAALAARQPGGCCVLADLPADPASAARARRITRDALARWGLHALADDAEMVASELAANAIAAAVPPRGDRPAIIFTVHHQPPDLRISVWDNGPGHPRPAIPGDDAEAGRGLAIIDALTDRQWGWWPTLASGGKVAWAALTTHAAPGR